MIESTFLCMMTSIGKLWVLFGLIWVGFIKNHVFSFSK